MRGDLRRPLFRKLVQLHKVIEYLSFHLEEHIHEVEETRKRYDAAEDELAREVQERFEAVKAKHDIGKNHTENDAAQQFQRQISEMQSELAQCRTRQLAKLDDTRKSLETLSETAKLTIDEINSGLERQFEFLRNDSNFRPDAEAIERERKFKETLRVHDEESMRKEKLFTKQTEENEHQLRVGYLRTVMDLRSQLRLPKPFRKRIQILTGRMNERISAMKEELEKERRIFTSNIFAEMRMKARSDTEEMVRIGLLRSHFEREMALEDARHKEILDEMAIEQRKRMHACDVEIAKLKLELEKQKVHERLEIMKDWIDEYKKYAALKRGQNEEKEWIDAAKELIRLKKVLDDAKTRKYEEIIRLPQSLEPQETEIRRILDSEYEQERKRKQEEVLSLEKELNSQADALRVQCDDDRKELLDALFREFSTQDTERAKISQEQACKSLRQKIAQESERQAKILQEEMEKERMESRERQSKIDELKAKLADIQKKTDIEVRSIGKAFQTKKTKITQQHKKQCDVLNEEIVKLREKADEQKNETLALMKKQQSAYDTKIASLENQLSTHKQRSQSSLDYTNRINRLTMAKNRAKSRFECAGARDIERNQINKLENIVAQRSMELSRLGRGLVAAKQAHDAKTQSLNQLPKLTTIE